MLLQREDILVTYDAPLQTPMAPRGKPSDITEKDLEEFRASFSDILLYE
jgi:hypothetical protein